MSDPGGNVYDKYASRHPVERRLMDGFLTTFDRLVERTGARRAHEVGCGEGELSLRMARAGLEVRGSDAHPEVVAEARRRATDAALPVRYEARPVQELEPDRDDAELVVCCEVLEHLEDPGGALETLASLARPWLIVSVPREPLWRALNITRLKYMRALGDTPGHLGHWSSRAFRSFLERRVEVIELQKPLPWTMALCRVEPARAEKEEHPPRIAAL